MLRTTTRFLDEDGIAVDLGQTPADFVFLSFSDSDLGLMASCIGQSRETDGMSARLSPLGMLRHPYSVDAYVESVVRGARFVLVRLLGGLDYWRYGVDELRRAARIHGFELALVPGDHRPDTRLDECSTLPAAQLQAIWSLFQCGGTSNIPRLLDWVEDRTRGVDRAVPDAEHLPSAGRAEQACRWGGPEAPRALIIFYRSYQLAGDTAPITALADALAARGVTVEAVFVTSLKDPDAAAWLAVHIAGQPPDIVLNSTAFAARTDGVGSPLDRADCPVLQVIHAGASRDSWQDNPRGLGGTDLAMHVVLPEIDGRITTRAISFKEEVPRDETIEFTRLIHQPDASGIDFAADLAVAWIRLRRLPRRDRKLACIVSDYPAKAGRAGYAVGLDTPASLDEIAVLLAEAGYRIPPVDAPDELMRQLAVGTAAPCLPLDSYESLFAALPDSLQATVLAEWGPPATDPALQTDRFCFRVRPFGNMLVAIQPDRGRPATRKASYHDATQAPCHSYIAFYLWLRHVAAVDAVIQLGTHGTLEWLPGKAVALSDGCAPAALLGPMPLIYPFIVNNPGEAAQAKRRSAAVIVSHLTPPLDPAGTHGAMSELEALFDEYAAAEQLDPKRARLVAATIIDRARETGLAADCGIDEQATTPDALIRLDAWLCDIKDMRIADGLHVFGRAPSDPMRVLAGSLPDAAARHRLDASPAAERTALLRALDGKFIEPGPAGAPSRGRLDVLPTGRNLFTIDPRAVPTPTAWEIGRRAAAAVVTRHLQDQGDWPRRLVLDLWGSATMRTGGEELAQIFAYLGAQPVWDENSSRVTGFTILPQAVLPHPRIDVTVRMSGLFRDVFPTQIALLGQLIAEIALQDEDADTNPLAAAARRGSANRLYGPASGTYGTPLGRMLAENPWVTASELAEAYLAASGHSQATCASQNSHAGDLDGGFAARVAEADAFVHVQDLAGQDLLDSSAFAEHEGGFAAASKLLGGRASLYHVDTTRTGRPAARTVREEVARVVRGRAANPRWIAGQMRHGYRGGAEIAETVDNLYAFAVTSDTVATHQFDLVYDATLGQDAVVDFLRAANPEALTAIAQRFDQAQQRGFWTSRRNSVVQRLGDLLSRAS